MNVNELLTKLSFVPDKETPVFISNDEEGNSYSKLYDISYNSYIDTYGEIEIISEEDKSDFDNCQDCIVLYP